MWSRNFLIPTAGREIYLGGWVMGRPIYQGCHTLPNDLNIRLPNGLWVVFLMVLVASQLMPQIGNNHIPTTGRSILQQWTRPNYSLDL